MNYPKLKDRKRTEKEITAEIRAYLNMRGIFHWKVWQGLGSKKGVSDILGVLHGGKILCIEVKTEKGWLNENQAAFLDAIKHYGGVVILAKSVADVKFGLEGVK